MKRAIYLVLMGGFCLLMLTLFLYGSNRTVQRLKDIERDGLAAPGTIVGAETNTRQRGSNKLWGQERFYLRVEWMAEGHTTTHLRRVTEDFFERHVDGDGRIIDPQVTVKWPAGQPSEAIISGGAIGPSGVGTAAIGGALAAMGVGMVVLGFKAGKLANNAGAGRTVGA